MAFLICKPQIVANDCIELKKQVGRGRKRRGREGTRSDL